MTADPLAGLEAKTEREILLVVVERQHVHGTRLTSIDNKLGHQNGRLTKLEEWKWRILGGGVIIVAGSPFFIFEFRQWVASVAGG